MRLTLVPIVLLAFFPHTGEAAGVNYPPTEAKPQSWQGKFDENAPKAAAALAKRVLSKHSEHFDFESVRPVNGRDVFEIETRDGRTIIRGNTAVSMAVGLNWYLKHYCHCHVSLRGNQLKLPDPLPEVRPKLRRTSWAQYRYFLNYCAFGYSMPFWDWSQWEELIDWMALNGVNAPLAVTGQEATWRNVCRRLNMSDKEIREFLAGPPYLPFQWMGCLDGWGGPLPKRWVDRHEALAKQILARERELGMRPILQGFTGHVPEAILKRHPQASAQKIKWVEWDTHLLDPLDPLFPKIAKVFMEEQSRQFGTDHLYAADTFIEMTPPSGEPDYLGKLSRAIYRGMAETDSSAKWVLQSWPFKHNSRFWNQERIAAFLDAIPHDKMLVLDLQCEWRPLWKGTQAFCGKPWLWCNIQNFGDRTFIGGALNLTNTEPHAVRNNPKSGRLAGLGFVNESLCNNPVIFEMMFETAWRSEAVDCSEWVAGFARRRYGSQNARAQDAWQHLYKSVYRGGRGGSLSEAWRALLDAADELNDVDPYRFDLVHVARQVLSDQRGSGMPGGSRSRAKGAAREQLTRDMDRLLATRKEFLLGRWLADARRWGDTDEERAKMEWNARRIITKWGATRRLDNYAWKEWSGMLTGFYLPVEQKKLDPNTWSQQTNTYPTEPQGNSVLVAKELWEKYGKTMKRSGPVATRPPTGKPNAISLTTGKPSRCSHALPSFPAKLANDGRSNVADRCWATDVQQHTGPAWWQVDLEKPTSVGRVIVVGYYGDGRHYGFTVETSLDAEKWEMAADLRENKKPSTSKGYTCTFEPKKARYIRVTQTHNSANPGRHLVEVMAFEK